MTSSTLPSQTSTRQNSVCSRTSDASRISSSSNSSTHADATPTAPVSHAVLTRGDPYCAVVHFERPAPAQLANDVIFVVVRLSNKFAQSAVQGAEDLPSRPRPRSFLERLSTRLSTMASDARARDQEYQYKAIYMPRSEYYRHFRRDERGNYVGSEPQREWDLSDLMREYGEWQNTPRASVAVR